VNRDRRDGGTTFNRNLRPGDENTTIHHIDNDIDNRTSEIGCYAPLLTIFLSGKSHPSSINLEFYFDVMTHQAWVLRHHLAMSPNQGLRRP
jgi:hypothetical protein